MADLLQNSPEFNKIMKFKPALLSWLILGGSLFLLFLLFMITQAIKIPRTVLIPLPRQEITWLTDRRLVLSVSAADKRSVEQAEKMYLIGKDGRQEVFPDRWMPDSATHVFRLEISLAAPAKLKRTREDPSLALECNLPGDSFLKKIIHSIF